MSEVTKFENSILQFCIDALEIANVPSVEQGFIAVNYQNAQNLNLTYIKPFNEDELPDYIINNSRLKKKFLKAYKQHMYRDPKDIYYYKNLKANANTNRHFSIRLKDFSYSKDAFYWNNADKKLIEYLQKNNPSSFKAETVGEEVSYTFNWECLEIIIDGKWRESSYDDLYYHNDFDFFFLKSPTNNYTFIPVPILSAITIWYVLDGDKIQAEDYFNEIYSETRYAVLNHVVEALSYYITEKINRDSIKTAAGFVDEYVKSLAGLVLPIAYRYCKINEGESNCLDNGLPRCLTEHCDDSCFETERCQKRQKLKECDKCILNQEHKCKHAKDCNPLTNIYSEHLPCPFCYLSSGEDILQAKEVIKLYTNSDNHFYYVTFYLPVFKIFDDAGESVSIQTHSGYKASAQLFKSLVESNFRLLYKQWKGILEVKKHATRAAISQAMLRNESHNHGSHVLVNLVSAKSLNEELFKKLFNKDHYLYQSDLEDEELTKEGQIAIFNKYVKGRMDFLSEITFGVSNMLTSINLREVYHVLDKNLILLNHIAGVDNFKFRIDLKHSENIPLYQLPVAFPSDILGCQALYNIIEAVIRNSAKYGSTYGLHNDETVFTMVFSDMPIKNYNESQFYKVEIYDNRNFISERKLFEIQDIIRMTVIDEKTNELRSKGLGILEMQACAAFLRQIDVSEIDNEKYYPNEIKDLKNKFEQLPILEPFLKDNNRLGYRFYMQKPKEFLFIGDWGTELTNYKSKLERFGVNFLTADDFIKSLEEGKTFYHQFLLYDDTIKDKIIKTPDNIGIRILLNDVLQASRNTIGVPVFLTRLPVRMMCVTNSKGDLIKLLKPTVDNDFSFDDLDEKIWALWKDKLFKRLNINNESEIKLISGPINIPIDEETEQIICLLNHNQDYQECKSINGLKAIEPLSSNARKKLPGWKDAYGKKLKEYIQAIQIIDTEHLVFNEFKDYLSDKNITIESDILSSYVDIKKELIKKMNNGELEADLVKQLLAVGYSINKKYSNIHKTNVFTKNVAKLFEAYANFVTVIDERIQEYVSGDYLGIRNQDVFKGINCMIPAKKYVNLADQELHADSKSKTLAFIEECINQSSFLVIHYGLLERLFNSEENRGQVIKNQLSVWATNTRVVVTSGRGKHSLDLPDDVCYINLSPITNVFIENRSKYAINYLLNQTRC